MIIVCDDNDVYSTFVADTLRERTNLEVIETRSCEDLIKQMDDFVISDIKPSIIIMDLVMFPVTGLECIEYLQGIHAEPVPIVAMSGAIQAQDLGKLRELGVMSFISKTHDDNELKRDLDAILHLHLNDVKPIFTRRSTDVRRVSVNNENDRGDS